MLKTEQQKKLAVVCLFAATVLILLSFIEPGYSEICRYYEHPDRKDCASYNLVYVAFWHVANAIDAASVAITGVATALLAYITWRLVRLGVDSGETSRAQLRAYISIFEAGLEDVAVGKAPRAVVTIKNFGQTPAHGFRQAARMSLMEFPLKVPPPKSLGDDCAEGVLGPGGSLIIHPILKDTILVEQHILLLQQGKLAIYVYGEYDYRDVFGRLQTGSYCLFSGGGIVSLGNLASLGAPYNCAT